MRSTEDHEIRLGSYELFYRGEPLTETVWEKLMLGLTTRKYGQAWSLNCLSHIWAKSNPDRMGSPRIVRPRLMANAFRKRI